MLPKEIKKFINLFEKLPFIGPRQAMRLAFKLINSNKDSIMELSNSVKELTNIKLCSQCFFVHTNENNLCDICTDKSRNKNIFMIVEKETDLISIENSKTYNGQYLIIGDLEKSGTLKNWQKLRIKSLINRIKKTKNSKADEIIIALNSTTYGDLNASLLEKELNKYTKKITRLGKGIPTGGEIEFTDPETLSSAIKRRQ